MDIRLNGITFYYQIDGREGAPWIVFSNSLTTDIGMWDGEVAQLKDRYRILRYDTRGHGKTEASAPPYSFDLLVSDVIALMDALEIDKAHYVGLSLGGMTGLGVAIEHGDRLHSLAACDARAFAEPAWAELWNARMDAVRKAGMDVLVEPTIERWFTDDFRKTSPEVLDKVRAMIGATAVDGYIGCALALQQLNYAPRLGEIGVPCLFMTGASDQSTPPEASRAMHEAVPGSTCVIVDPASHISNVENPEQFDRALFDHLERAGSG